MASTDEPDVGSTVVEKMRSTSASRGSTDRRRHPLAVVELASVDSGLSDSTAGMGESECCLRDQRNGAAGVDRPTGDGGARPRARVIGGYRLSTLRSIREWWYNRHPTAPLRPHESGTRCPFLAIRP